MIKYLTGNILRAKTESLVNTVNCEGFMGKGIAYQFKLEFPDNNVAYVDACKNGNMRVGKIFPFEEQKKIIFNFPTKNKWREKSKYDYIEKGLEDLIRLIQSMKVKSVAIPPLGCGNGGLKWPEVKDIMQSKLETLSDVEIWIYEPSKNIKFASKAKKPPKLNASHLLLMNIKMSLTKFNKFRLQKTSYLINYLSGQDYFKFEPHHFGPYAHSIEILSKDIKEYQNYYGFTNTMKAYNQARKVLISETIKTKEKTFTPYLRHSSEIVNQIESDRNLELLSSLIFLISKEKVIKIDELIDQFGRWSERKATNFSKEEIKEAIKQAKTLGLVNNELYGLTPLRPKNVPA